MIMLKLNIKIEQDYVTWIQIAVFVALRPKAYSYLTNNFIEMKKTKGTKKNAL